MVVSEKKSIFKKKKKKVVVVVFDNVEILDVAGPCSVFSKANFFNPGSYDVSIFSNNSGKEKTNSALVIETNNTWNTALYDDIDTLIIAGGDENKFIDNFKNKDFLSWLSSTEKKVRRLVSVCTGVFALGYAGLLHGRQVTTHWRACELLQNEFPETVVLRDKVYVHDKKIWSSAGVLTGIDLALALVEEDLGREIAIKIGELLVMAGIRLGESPQQSSLFKSQSDASSLIKELLAWLQFNFTEDCGVDALASRMGISKRHLSRLFIEEVGMSPSRYVQMKRLDYAVLLLKDTKWSIKKVAENSGFLSTESLRRGFIQRWGVTPCKYRHREEARSLGM